MPLTSNRAELESEIIEIYNRYAQGIDSKQWDLVRSCFADEVYIDYGAISDSSGSPEVPRKARDWLTYLQGVINGFDITRHTITNHRFQVKGELVECSAYLMADHVIFNNPEMPIASADELVTVVGEYTNTYQRTADGWKICKSRLVVNYSTGNVALFVTATERAAALASG